MTKKLETITIQGTAHVNTERLEKAINKRVTARKCSANSATISTKGGFSEKEAIICAEILGLTFTGRCIR